MLGKSDTSIADVMKVFGKYGLEANFVVPTETGLKKSILDAIAPVRDFLKKNGVHDYETQPQGPDNKITIDCCFVNQSTVTRTKATLYRPLTKGGDPRIWFYGLNSYAKPNNLISILVFEKQIFVINASDKNILRSIEVQSSPLGRIAHSNFSFISEPANELLSLLKDVASKGFIPSLRHGDTGIGYTLEEMLGIKVNSSKLPDFKGIEIKASRSPRLATRSKTRVNLFSQVPDWSTSQINTAYDLLKQYGYSKDGRLQLYCSMDANKPNSQNLMLKVDHKDSLLNAIEKKELIEHKAINWGLCNLRDRMAEKHAETFWVKADVDIVSGKEYFHYQSVIHTSKPIVSNIDYLLEDGTITVDLTMSEKNGRVRDHGYLFKIWPKDLPSLFPPPKLHDLVN